MLRGVGSNWDGGDVNCTHVLVGSPSGNSHLQEQEGMCIELELTGSGLYPIKIFHMNTAVCGFINEVKVKLCP
jgi:hypothetical protein